jgi:uncharacterized protein (DUF486 family)
MQAIPLSILLQVPANRIGYTAMTRPQPNIVQQVITFAVFVPFVAFYILCFIFREVAGAP